MIQSHLDTQLIYNKWSRAVFKSIAKKDHLVNKFLQLPAFSIILQELLRNSLLKKTVNHKMTTYCQQSDAQKILVRSQKDFQRLNINTDSSKDQQAWPLKPHLVWKSLIWKMWMSYLKPHQKELKTYNVVIFQPLLKIKSSMTRLISLNWDRKTMVEHHNQDSRAKGTSEFLQLLEMALKFLLHDTTTRAKLETATCHLLDLYKDHKIATCHQGNHHWTKIEL